MDRLVAAVAREIELRLAGVRLSGQANTSTHVGTVYFGGGTPSMLGHEQLARMLAAIRERCAVSSGAEVTVEANPLDVTAGWAESCLAAGFNRLSIGVQSVVEDDLRFLGRLHHAEDGRRSAEVARSAGFGEIGIDLIYGLPGQTPEGLRERVTAAVGACRPEHVSCYQLTYAEGTPLANDLAASRVRRLSDDEEYALFVGLHHLMGELGYPAYEVSNFSLRDGRRSRHNSNYWRHVPYVGLGPSAHSFDGRVRSWNVASVRDYLSSVENGRLPLAGSEELSDEQLAAEMILLALRTTDGLDLALYRDRFGRDFVETNRDAIEQATRQGLLAVSDSHVRPTVDGLAVADRLAAEFN